MNKPGKGIPLHTRLNAADMRYLFRLLHEGKNSKVIWKHFGMSRTSLGRLLQNKWTKVQNTVWEADKLKDMDYIMSAPAVPAKAPLKFKKIPVLGTPMPGNVFAKLGSYPPPAPLSDFIEPTPAEQAFSAMKHEVPLEAAKRALEAFGRDMPDTTKSVRVGYEIPELPAIEVANFIKDKLEAHQERSRKKLFTAQIDNVFAALDLLREELGKLSSM